MGRRKSGKERYNFLIDPQVYTNFSRICYSLGLIRSKKIELLMKEFVSDVSGRLVTTQKKGRYNFLIDPQVYTNFSRICDEHGLIRSKKIELLMKTFVDEQSRMRAKTRRVVS